jgi:hypothetical protein
MSLKRILITVAIVWVAIHFLKDTKAVQELFPDFDFRYRWDKEDGSIRIGTE